MASYRSKFSSSSSAGSNCISCCSQLKAQAGKLQGDHPGTIAFLVELQDVLDPDTMPLDADQVRADACCRSFTRHLGTHITGAARTYEAEAG